MLTLQNEHLSVQVDVDLGAEIVAVCDPAGRNALARYDWDSPTPAGRGLGYGDPELDWLSAHRGGWQETVPNAGQTCVVDGVPMGFHGDATRTPWEVVAITADSCELRCSSRLPLTITRRMRLAPGLPALLIEGTVQNWSPAPVDIVWGQHPALPALPGGRLDVPDGCVVHLDPERTGGLEPAESSWPDATAIDGGPVDLSLVPDESVHRLLYLTGHKEGWAAVRQPDEGVGVALAWDLSRHPYLWLWLMRKAPDFPWFGRASMLALEAQAAWPYDGLAAARSRGQAITVPAHGSVDSWYTCSLLPNRTPPVIGVSRDGHVDFEERP